MTDEAEPRRLGVWLVGARGAISTCVVYGLAGLRRGLLEPVGLVTESEPFSGLPFAGLETLVLGGHEVLGGDLSRGAAELVQNGVLSPQLVAACAEDAAAYDARVRPGLLDGPDVGGAELHPTSASLGGVSPREQVAALRADLHAFREEHELDRVVMCQLATTEAWRDPEPAWTELARFEAALDAGEAPPASCLYAYAALQEGLPHVNFTPNRAASLPALRQLARERGLPHCGDDAKTGETLLKTTLAPMFTARALRVLAWQGYNMLGNRDGAALADPVRLESKRRNKDAVVHELLGEEVHSTVGIDYVPSLHDWKTAMDYVHFEGFLGARMGLQFTWRGSDSALAAPLVLDLVRWADLAAQRGEAGEMDHTACYFKSPLTGGTHDFLAQHRRLLEYAR